MSAPNRFQRSGGDPRLTLRRTLLDVHNELVRELDPELIARAHLEALLGGIDAGMAAPVPPLGGCAIRLYREVTPRAHEEMGGGLQFSFTDSARRRLAVNVPVYCLPGLVEPAPPFEYPEAEQVARAVERLPDICRREGFAVIPELTHLVDKEPLFVMTLHQEEG